MPLTLFKLLTNVTTLPSFHSLTRVRMQSTRNPTLESFALDQVDLGETMLQRFPAINPQHWARELLKMYFTSSLWGPNLLASQPTSRKYRLGAPGAMSEKGTGW